MRYLLKFDSGTQLYQRFSPLPFQAIMEPGVSSKGVYEAVTSADKWTHKITPFSLPSGFDIMMGDVCGGSSSTSMVGAKLVY
jgi:phosphomevalonate kinase